MGADDIAVSVQPEAYHLLSREETLQLVGCKDPEEGLTELQVIKNREKYGSNALKKGQGKSLAAILFANFCNVLTLLLAIVIVIAAVNEEWIECVVVALVIVLNR